MRVEPDFTVMPPVNVLVPLRMLVPVPAMMTGVEPVISALISTLPAFVSTIPPSAVSVSPSPSSAITKSFPRELVNVTVNGRTLVAIVTVPGAVSPKPT